MSVRPEEMRTAIEILRETVQYYGEDPIARRGLKEAEINKYNSKTSKYEKDVGWSCRYVVENGETKYCAVGRVLTEEARMFAKENNGSVEDLIQEWWTTQWAKNEWDDLHPGGCIEEGDWFNESDYEFANESDEFYMDDMLQLEYRGHSTAFWQKVQALHDKDTNWSGSSVHEWLTEDGFIEARTIAAAHGTSTEEINNFLAEIRSRTEGHPS